VLTALFSRLLDLVKLLNKLVRLFITQISLIALSVSTIQASEICRHGGQTIDITLQDAVDAPSVNIRVDTDYLDQRFIYRSGSTRRGLGLRLQATDFAPWPHDVRPHQSEGPYLRMLLSAFVDFELIVQRLTIMTQGYSFTDEIEWRDLDGPFGLKILTAPPLETPRIRGGIGDHDVYFARNPNGAVTDVIRCRRPGKTPFQTCGHRIDIGIFDVKIDYSPEFLPQWRRLSDDARAFFSCLTIEQ
jgi:hypothetical protein